LIFIQQTVYKGARQVVYNNTCDKIKTKTKIPHLQNGFIIQSTKM